MVQSERNGFFEMTCVCIADSDSHHFRVDLKFVPFWWFHLTKECICVFLHVCILQQGQCCKAFNTGNKETKDLVNGHIGKCFYVQ